MALQDFHNLKHIVFNNDLVIQIQAKIVLNGHSMPPVWQVDFAVISCKFFSMLLET